MDWMLLLAGAGLVAGAVLGGAMIRRVPTGHRGVVLRRDLPVRQRTPGLVLVLPVVERLERVPLAPAPIDPLAVTATTRDGVEVHLLLSLLWSVTDPLAAAQAGATLRSATEEGAERAARHLVANVAISDLLRDREAVLGQLRVTARPLLMPLGVELDDVDLLDTRLRAGPELLRLLA